MEQAPTFSQVKIKNNTKLYKQDYNFEIKGADLRKKNLNNSIEVTSKAVQNKMKTSDTICNIPSTK